MSTKTMSNFKTRFKSKDVIFAEKATTKGVIVGCKSCKKPLWNVIIKDAVSREAETTAFPGVPEYKEVWSEDNMKDITKFPACWHCDKSWMDVITGPGGTLFPKPYIL